MRIFHLFFGQTSYKNATKSSRMFHCIKLYNSSKIYLQFFVFSDKFELLVKSKMAMAAILDEVTGH